jgi:hypothetical protein
MPDIISLIKENPLLPAEDYAAMRKEGFQLIEKLGSDYWTDYNNSDPGITMLEAVLYAITDLAYRTGFEIKDLLAPEQVTEDTWKQIFYTAKQILHNSALTLVDYRKMIIDVKGVRNAWVEPSKEYEVPVWIDYNTYELKIDEHCHCDDHEAEPCMGNLGIEATTPETAAAFLAKKKTEAEAGKEAITKQQTELSAAIQKIEDQIAKETDAIALEELKKNRDKLSKQYEKAGRDLGTVLGELDLIAAMKYVPSKIVEFEGIYNVMVEYEEDVLEEDQREEVRQLVVQRLSRHRNLCEDFLTVNAVEYEDIGLGVSISLEEYADPDQVLAQLFFIIYKYFTPSIPFYTIQQMLDKGYDIDQVFEGPALSHGFIEDKDIEKTSLYRDIRLSDIINEIADIKGVVAITYLHLPFNGFENDEAGKAYFDQWVKYLQAERKVARISPELSQVIFCKQKEMITYNTGNAKDRRPNRMLKLFRDFKIAERKYKLEGITLDLAIPVGENMELEDYYPVTYSLPMTYGVSDRAGLPGNADEKRKIQALQLKGYLLFFEQLLAGHLVQLNHLRELFTMDESVEHTYFNRVLTEIQGLQALLIDQNNRGSDHFDQVQQDFMQVLQQLMESPEQFASRRNRFLEHFLGRFSEDRKEYDAINRWLMPAGADQRLVQDKINMLKDGEYTAISSDRGRGYNYTCPDFWDTDNVSGTERRIGRLLGFKSIERHDLAPRFIITEPVMVLNNKKQQEQKLNKKGKPLNVVKFLDPENNEQVLLTSVEAVEGCCTELLISDILEHADIIAHTKQHDDLNRRARKTAGPVGSFWFEVWDGPDVETAVLLAESMRFDKKENRDIAFTALQNAMKDINSNEGLHMVEHLLLRPRLDEVLDENNEGVPVSFLDICLDACDLGIGLDEGAVPVYRKKISRIPAEKCYDKMPWVLEYINAKKQSILFQEVDYSEERSTTIPLKFRRYTALSQRVEDIREYGSERVNYKIVSNQEEDATRLKYGFIITGDNNVTLAQSLFAYNKRTKAQVAQNTKIKDDIEDEITALMTWFGAEMDWYCQVNPCDNNEDPYSFRTTAVLPCWPKRFRDATFRNLVEKTIAAESPAHIQTRIVWLGLTEMKRFEEAYYNWLEEMSVTEIPAYEKVNPLVSVMNTLRPCGICEDDCDCQDTNIETEK